AKGSKNSQSQKPASTVPEDRVPKDRVSEDRVPEDRVSEDRVSEDRVSEDRVPEDIPEDRFSEDSVSEDRVPEDSVPEDSVFEDRVPEDNLFLPEVLRGPPGQGRPVAQAGPDDAGPVRSDPVPVELQRLRGSVQIRHRLVQVKFCEARKPRGCQRSTEHLQVEPEHFRCLTVSLVRELGQPLPDSFHVCLIPDQSDLL
uniref:Uncharacterized protein n=1 Tax=Kryptolebias marmoratus TaxID=37003 RepID=A0A3Q3B6Q5_KRYMA